MSIATEYTDELREMENALAYDEGAFASASDALWFLNCELEQRAREGDLEAKRYLEEMNTWEDL